MRLKLQPRFGIGLLWATLGFSACFAAREKTTQTALEFKGRIDKGYARLALGCVEEADAVFRGALGQAHVTDDVDLIIQARLALGQTAVRRGDKDDAMAQYDQALLHARQEHRSALEVESLVGRSGLQPDPGDDLKAARTLCEQSAPAECGLVYNAQGLEARRGGRMEEARRLWESALAANQGSGRTIRQADNHLNLGLLDEVEGRPDAARAHYLRARELDAQVSNRAGLAQDLLRLSELEEHAERREAALSYGLRALGALEVAGDRNALPALLDRLIPMADSPALKNELAALKEHWAGKTGPPRCQ